MHATLQYNDTSPVCAMAPHLQGEKKTRFHCACTNKNPQLQSAGGIGQLAATDREHPTRCSELVNLAAALTFPVLVFSCP